MRTPSAEHLNPLITTPRRPWPGSVATAAAREGIAAFQEKRKPDFKKTG